VIDKYMKNNKTPFIGRKKELKQLKRLLEKGSASLVVLKGRRRIGKSRLIEEYGKDFTQVYIFSGLPPTPQTTLEDQLNDFGWYLGQAFDEPAFKETDWNDLFLRLARRTTTGKILILFDEISWMGSKDPNFLGKLKNAWDLQFKKNPQLIMVLCGSVSSWIEKNILSSTGFLGRISLNLNLEELSLSDCNQFWLNWTEKISAYEKFKVLAITGGVPKYLEEIKPQLSAEENIRQLCFERSGLLFNEFDQIFSDIFSQRNTLYKEILYSIMNGYFEYEEIYKKLGVEKSGLIGEYLEDLITSGFLARDYTWHLKTGKVSKLSRFRISDNYLRFYLKYILSKKDKIRNNAYDNVALTLLPQWETIMGLQFENLVLHNRQKIQNILGIKPEEIIYDNPFFQHKTTRWQGCQIDYLIQTRDTLYICEIKFSRKLIKAAILKEVQQKIDRLKMPRNFSRRCVLIHVNGVEDSVLESQFFSGIIDFSQLLQQD
jgi:uncharacterized protein